MVERIDKKRLNTGLGKIGKLNDATRLLKSYIAQLKLAACGGKRGRERAWSGGSPPLHALSLLWGGVGNTFDDI